MERGFQLQKATKCEVINLQQKVEGGGHKEQRKENKFKQFPSTFKLISLLAILTLAIECISRTAKGCEQVLDSNIYEVIRSRVDVHQFHGYQKVSKCSQTFYQSERKQAEKYNQVVEAYANESLKTYGTGYIDFQFPDSAFYSVDFGMMTFPSKLDCTINFQKSPMVYLSTMITAHDFRAFLLETFLDYYIGIGIARQNILLTIQLNSDIKLELLLNTIDTIERLGVYYDVFIGNWSSEALMVHQAHKLLYCTRPEDWIVVADSDEFHEYPVKNITVFLHRLESKGINVVNGIFLDRISVDGSLKEPNKHSHLFTQFELGCSLHRQFNLGTPKKVMAFKGDLRINRGHHRLALCWFWYRRNYLDLTPWNTCPPNTPLKVKVYPKRLTVHHFKWMRGQYEATERKAKVWEGTTVGESYNDVLKHLDQCGGVCVANISTKCHKVDKLMRKSKSRTLSIR